MAVLSHLVLGRFALQVEANQRCLQKQIEANFTQDNKTKTELFVMPNQTYHLLCKINRRLLMCSKGLLFSFCVYYDSTFLHFSAPFSETKHTPLPVSKNESDHGFICWPLAGPVSHFQLQGSLKSWKYLFLMLANNPIRNMI